MGASGGPKSRPKGVRTAKRCLGQGRRRGQDSHLRPSGRLYNKSCYFLKCRGTLGKLPFFKGRGSGAKLGATWAQKSRPRVVSQDSQNDLDQGRRRGQSSKGWTGQVRLSVRAVEPEWESEWIGGQGLSKRPVI